MRPSDRTAHKSAILAALLLLFAAPSTGAQDAIGVEHLGTTLSPMCAGNITIVDQLPNEIPTGFTSTGVVELFKWHENGTVDAGGPHLYDFGCKARPVIVGRAWGGVMRQLVLENDCCQILLCEYDGITQTGCTGEFTSVERYGHRGAFDPRTTNRSAAVARMTLEHEAGWTLANLGQGSTAVYSGLDPDPAPVPGQRFGVTVAYNFTDDRLSETAQAAPAVPLVFALAALVLVTARRS